MLTDQQLQSLRNTSNEAEDAADEIVELRRDVLRYRRFREMVGARRDLWGHVAFCFPGSDALPPLGDIMSGSLAQHLDAAIDAAIAHKEPAPCQPLSSK